LADSQGEDQERKWRTPVINYSQEHSEAAKLSKSCFTESQMNCILCTVFGKWARLMHFVLWSLSLRWNVYWICCAFCHFICW